MKLTGPNLRIMLLLVFLVLTNTALFDLEQDPLCQCLEDILVGVAFRPSHLDLDEASQRSVNLFSSGGYGSLQWLVLDEGSEEIVKRVSEPAPQSGEQSTTTVTSVDRYGWDIRKEPERETSIRIGGREEGGEVLSRALGITARAPRLSCCPIGWTVTDRIFAARTYDYHVLNQQNDKAVWSFSVSLVRGTDEVSQKLAQFAGVAVTACEKDGQVIDAVTSRCEGQKVFLKAELAENAFNEALLNGEIPCGRFFPEYQTCYSTAVFELFAERNTRVISKTIQLSFLYRIPPNP